MEDEPQLSAAAIEFSTCRMYEQKYPQVEELVQVQVKEIADMGAYVSLLEYGNIQGLNLFFCLIYIHTYNILFSCLWLVQKSRCVIIHRAPLNPATLNGQIVNSP